MYIFMHKKVVNMYSINLRCFSILGVKGGCPAAGDKGKDFIFLFYLDDFLLL